MCLFVTNAGAFTCPLRKGIVPPLPEVQLSPVRSRSSLPALWKPRSGAAFLISGLLAWEESERQQEDGLTEMHDSCKNVT